MVLPKIARSLSGRSLRIAFTTLISVVAIPLSELSEISLHFNRSFSWGVLAQTPTEGKTQAERLLEQGVEQYNTNQFQAAIASWQQALNLYREISDRTGESKVLNNLGIAYYSLGEYVTAIDYQQQSLSIAREIGDRALEGAALNSLGICYKRLGEYTTAIEHYQQSLHIAREIGDRVLESAALSGLGNIYNQLGEYATAIEYHQQSLTIDQETGNRAGEGATLNNLGNTYLSLAEYATAIEYYQGALGIATEIGNRAGEGATLNGLGNAYFYLGDYLTAIEYHQQYLAIARETGNRAIEGIALNNLGNAYLALEDYTTAIEYHQQSLAIAREIGDRVLEGKTLGSLGATYDLLGEYATAIDYHQQSVAIAREIGDRALEGMALGNLGRAFLKADQLNEAETALLQSIEVRETIREQLGDNDAWKVSIFEEQTSSYRWLQFLLITQNRVEDALEISERGRARAFVELMAQRLGNDSEISPKVEIPNFEQIKQVAQQQNATLVEYSLVFSDQLLYIWVIHPTGEITFRSVNLTESENPLTEVAEQARTTASTTRIRGGEQTETALAEMVRGTRDSIGNATVATPTATVELSMNRYLQQLHQLLIEPIADLLPSDPNQPVIFIPQGSLFLVPFAALQDETGTYLIEKHTILTSPAIQVLELTQQQSINETGEILIVGNPTMPKVSIAPHQPPQQLNSLPGTELEASAIASLLNTDFLSGDRATETTIKQKMPGAKLIHLATHGLLEETSNGLLAAIALTPSNSDDGLLTPDEILSLQLSADLVVLSACDTGRGRITGDGVLGLSRSILTAGARSAIVSLWQVPDTQTAVLMSEFYRQWQQTGNKAQALRQAMLTTMTQYPHPMNWAAFTVMGEAD